MRYLTAGAVALCVVAARADDYLEIGRRQQQVQAEQWRDAIEAAGTSAAADVAAVLRLQERAARARQEAAGGEAAAVPRAAALGTAGDRRAASLGAEFDRLDAAAHRARDAMSREADALGGRVAGAVASAAAGRRALPSTEATPGANRPTTGALPTSPLLAANGNNPAVLGPVVDELKRRTRAGYDGAKKSARDWPKRAEDGLEKSREAWGGADLIRSTDDHTNRARKWAAGWAGRLSGPAGRTENDWLAGLGPLPLTPPAYAAGAARLAARRREFESVAKLCDAERAAVAAIWAKDYGADPAATIGKLLDSTTAFDWYARKETLDDLTRCRDAARRAAATIERAEGALRDVRIDLLVPLERRRSPSPPAVTPSRTSPATPSP